MLQADELKRRLDAIRTLRGLRQVDLAALVEQDGHGKHDVGRLERGDVPLTPSLRRSLAVHLRVPEEWFVEPDLDKVIAQATAPADMAERLDRMQEVLDQLEAWESAPVWQRVMRELTDALGQITDRLDRLDQRLGALEPAVGTVTELREALFGLATDSLRHTRELEELRGRGRQPGQAEDEQQ